MRRACGRRLPFGARRYSAAFPGNLRRSRQLLSAPEYARLDPMKRRHLRPEMASGFRSPLSFRSVHSCSPSHWRPLPGCTTISMRTPGKRNTNARSPSSSRARPRTTLLRSRQSPSQSQYSGRPLPFIRSGFPRPSFSLAFSSTRRPRSPKARSFAASPRRPDL